MPRTESNLPTLLVSFAVLLPSACSDGSSAAPPASGFGPTERFSTGAADGRALTFADIDGDGIGEALVANGASGNVSVLPGLPNGVFGMPSFVSGPAVADRLAVGDLDGTRTVDLAVGSSVAPELVLHFNRAGSLQAASPIPVSGPVRSLRIADVNRDGRADLVWTAADRPEIGLLLRDSGSGFTAEQRISLPAMPGELVVADFDRDGRPDLATAAAGQGGVFVVPNRSSGPGAPITTQVPPQSGALAYGDVDRDGRLDLVTLRSDGSTLDVLRGDGAASFSRMQEIALGDAAVSVALADADLDGDPDLWVGLATAVVLLENDGSGGFGASTTLVEDIAGIAAASARDLELDGITDLVYLSGGDQLVAADNPRAVPLGLDPYGTGTPDCRGALTLMGSGRPDVGSSDFALLAAGAPAAVPGMLVLGGPQDLAGSDPLGLGFRVHVGTDALTVRLVVTDGSGGLFHREPVPSEPSLAGLDVYGQALWLARPGESCSASPAGVVTSRGLHIAVLP